MSFFSLFRNHKQNIQNNENKELDLELISSNLHHIAFIMDGNGRYATRRNLPRSQGHLAGAENFQKVAEHCFRLGIKTVTVYAFSTENWGRPQAEVDYLMNLFLKYIDSAFDRCKEKGLRVRFIGEKDKFTKELLDKMNELEETTKDYPYLLNVALNYGSRAEILHAVNQCISSGKTLITEEDLSSNLYTAECGDPDLIVRTAGEERLSNFLLWQAAYSEFYFTKTLWPELSCEEIDEIVKIFLGRKRKFGKI